MKRRRRNGFTFGCLLALAGVCSSEPVVAQPVFSVQEHFPDPIDLPIDAAVIMRSDYWVAVGGYGLVAISVDSARSWDRMVLPGLPNLKYVAIHRGLLIAVADSGIVLSSDDSGRTWNSRPWLPGSVCTDTSEFGASWRSRLLFADTSETNIDSIDWMDRNTLVFVGRQTPEYRSTDWTISSHSPTNVRVSYFHVSFVLRVRPTMVADPGAALAVSDMLGREVHRVLLAGDPLLDLDISQLPDGAYLISIEGSGQVVTRLVAVSKAAR